MNTDLARRQGEIHRVGTDSLPEDPEGSCTFSILRNRCGSCQDPNFFIVALNYRCSVALIQK